MLDTTRLEIPRQLNVGDSLAEVLAKDRPTPLLAGTLARGNAVTAATFALASHSRAKPGKVDRATDTVVISVDHLLEAAENALLDSVVPLGEAQQQTLARVRLIRTSVFPQGTQFIRRPMDLEWPALRNVQSALGDPEVAAAVDALGLRAVVDHLLAHIARYGQAVGQEAGAAGTAEEKASLAWHEAFKLFAAQVMVDYEKDAALRQELLGAYEVQLAQQQSSARAARARRAQEVEPAPPSSSASPAAS